MNKCMHTCVPFEWRVSVVFSHNCDYYLNDQENDLFLLLFPQGSFEKCTWSVCGVLRNVYDFSI